MMRFLLAQGLGASPGKGYAIASRFPIGAFQVLGEVMPAQNLVWVVTAPISCKRYRYKQIGSYARAQELLRQGHGYLDKNGDGVACESLRN